MAESGAQSLCGGTGRNTFGEPCRVPYLCSSCYQANEHWANRCQGDGWTEYGDRCNGYANTSSPCRDCCRENERRNSAGFVETTDIKVKEMTEVFPITITAYRGTKEIKVSGVREDSLASKLDREGNVTLSFEFHGRPNDIGYIPCVDYYTTECD